MSELWTVQRVAAHLEVTPKRVYHLVQSGRLESLRLGPRAMRVTRESVEHYVQELIRREKRELGLDLDLRHLGRRKT